MNHDDDSTKHAGSHDEDREAESSFDFEVGGLFGGLGEVVEQLGELAEKGKTFERTGRTQSGDDGDVEGVWGVRIRTNIGGEGDRDVEVDSFGNMHTSEEEAEEVVVEERREPMVDVYDEESYVLITAEMPGVGEDDVRIRLDGDVMTLAAEQGDKRYYKELVLEEAFEPDDLEVRSKNGIIRITCHK